MPWEQRIFEDACQRFRNDFSDFTTFEHPGERYPKEERNGKLEFVGLYDEYVRPNLKNSAQEFYNAYVGILNHPLSEADYWAGMGMYPLTTLKCFDDLSTEESVQYGQMLMQVVKSNGSLDSITHYGDSAAELWGKRAHLGDQRNLLSLLLMLHDSTRFMYLSKNFWNLSSRLLSGEGIITGGRVTGEEFKRCQRFAQRVRVALEESGYAPKDMIDVQSFLNRVGKVKESQEETWYQVESDESQARPKPESTDLKRLIHQIRLKGMRIDPATVRQYHFSMRTRGFVILAGPSGVGKTWLTRLYANALDAEYLLAPVAPNWSTNEDLLGFFNPIDAEFHATAFLSFIDRATDSWDQNGGDAKEFHLVLDEMNLARVEHYFSLFLSLMEMRSETEVPETRLTGDRVVRVPPNLKFAGTVNMDETTHGFADKVFDRAQLIELSISSDAAREHISERVGDASPREVLLDLWDRMARACPVGFRVLDDIADYLQLAKQEDVDWRVALDEQIVSKLLPKLRGLDPEVAEALRRVSTRVEGEFPRATAKCQSMLRRLQSTDVVSFF